MMLLPLLVWSMAARAAPPSADGWYLGHSWVGNRRNLPVLGAIETRTDTWVLARVRAVEGGLEISQQPCAMRIRPVAGVKVGMEPDAVRRLPDARFLLEELATDTAAAEPGLHAPAWTTGWGEEDVDADGLPGATIRVQAALCGGHLQVASSTRSEASATWEGAALVGELSVAVQQRILDASGACLRVVARDSVEEMSGRFRYEPAPVGATCTSSPLEAWPRAAE